MERDKQFFYIFLNIKGALYTADWIKFTSSAVMAEEDNEYQATLDEMLLKHPDWNSYYRSRLFLRSKNIRKICPYNVEALNTLLNELKDNYDINLVITSQKWKEMFDLKTIPALVKNGLDYSGIVLDKTDIREEDTAMSIRQYLAQVGNPSNYLVIDYQNSLAKDFASDKLILCEERKTGLDKKSVIDYLCSASVIERAAATTTDISYETELELV